MSQVEAVTERRSRLQAAQNDLEDLHRRLVEATAREVAGQPNEFFPEPKKAGQGPRTKDLQRRDQETKRELDGVTAGLARESAALTGLNQSLAAARMADRNTLIDELPQRRAAFVQEAVERERVRKEKLDRLTGEMSRHAGDHERALRLHDDRYLPPIARYEAKIKGILDPMEETIGLYKVIFLPAPDASQTELGEQGYKWIAGLFQFLVVFGHPFRARSRPHHGENLQPAGAIRRPRRTGGNGGSFEPQGLSRRIPRERETLGDRRPGAPARLSSGNPAGPPVFTTLPLGGVPAAEPADR